MDTGDGVAALADWAKAPTKPAYTHLEVGASASGHNHDSAYLGISATAVDSDKLDGKSAGNASGNIPISNGILNTNLNAEFINGLPSSQLIYLPTSDYDHAGLRNLLTGGIAGMTLQTSGSGEVYANFPSAPYLIAGVSYVLSGWYKTTANVSSVQFFALGPVTYYWNLFSFTEWTYFEFTFIPSSTGNYPIRVDNNGSTNGQLSTVWCKDVQLEQGSVATARTRSHGDGVSELKCPYISHLGYTDDFYDAVIAFANLNQENSYTSGELLFSRPNGVIAPYRFLTLNQKMYAQSNMHGYHTTHGNTAINTLQKVKFNFHGVTYGGYRYSLQPQAMNVFWIGTGNHMPFMIVFRNTNSGAIHNAEVNSTLVAI